MRARPPRLPGYVLGQRLGGGPTCDVYSALDEDEHRPWAVKILREEAAQDATNVQLLCREAQVGMAVRHPHLVRVVEATTESGQPPHLVMEKVPGKSLRCVLRQSGWLPARLVGAVALHTVGALAAIHSAGYVHGDVKPDNIHLGDDRTATLLDLGFAHRPGDDASLLGAGFVLGTANYVAPELCDQPDRDGPAADIFSLGVTLFELLTGELPYPDGGVEDTMMLHRDSRPEPLGAWQGSWPSGVPALVDQMLARDPDERPTANQAGKVLTKLFPDV